MRTTKILATGWLVASVLIAACGGESDESTANRATAETATAESVSGFNCVDRVRSPAGDAKTVAIAMAQHILR